MNFADRSTCVLFGDGAGAVVIEPAAEEGFLGFELGADGAGGMDLYLPAGGSRMPTTAETVASGAHYVHMNGREVFKFATRVLVSSAEAVLREVRVVGGRRGRLCSPPGQCPDHRSCNGQARNPKGEGVVNVDRYGNTSSASIPLALAEASHDRPRPARATPS